MQESNWNAFKARFHGKEQKSFEWFCYLLFCKEFKRNLGIFKYKNQPGVETEPILHEGNYIGFQAKFYETKIKDNIKDIKDSIDKAKNRNANLNKILFYLNQEFSESSKKDKKEPVYKIEIENHAKSKEVEIEWRTAGFFESPFVCSDNKTISQHFFSQDKSLVDFMEGLSLHRENILASINSKINFKNQEIKIDRSQCLGNLKKVLVSHSTAILSGEAGVGKTAVIKDFYDSIKDKSPFFIFKATEFFISNINDLFKKYGDFIFLDFLKEHEGDEDKYLVIDSAEKLSDIENNEVVREFLTALHKNNWKVVFTTRYSYLDNLRFQLIAIYNVGYEPININNLTAEELVKLSVQYKFNLPTNGRMLEFLSNPFYLNEYLRHYDSVNNLINFSDFKNLLWSTQISKASFTKNNIHIKREESFLKIAFKRAAEGLFFVKAEDCDSESLQSLTGDEVIKYDSNAGGYFITHDIYEEWALDRIIERGFINSKEHKDFFTGIGSSLPIRRAFRNWLSENLRNNKERVTSFIEYVINSHGQIESHWTDEVYISILLSDYAHIFFQLFEKKLLEDNQTLLVRVIFLLRIACKEIDEDFLSLLGIQRIAGVALRALFTRPKGSGWACTINFIHKYKDKLGLGRINIIFSLLDDWTNKNKKGETTKQAGQIALYYYEQMNKDERFKYGVPQEQERQLIKIILNGASEITEELKVIFDEAISNKNVRRRDKHFKLIKTILSSITEGYEVIKSLPNYVLKLAEVVWLKSPDDYDEDHLYSRRMELEDYFSISVHNYDYFPASAFQTPIYQLLRTDPQSTVDFILSFVNKTVERYAKSGLDGKIDEVEVFIDDKQPIKQYLSSRLWCMYRGTQTAPHVLESMHMALEKWMLEIAKYVSKDILESWCFYLIKNSRSTSVTALVTSVVLSQPSKLFGVARILFQTKEFFVCDTGRMMLDQNHKSQLVGLGGIFPKNYENEMYDDERIKACDEGHRKRSLEYIALQYQLFREKDENENEAEEKQKIIWGILDKYYSLLPNKSSETDFDKTWRLYLARMDRRKMNPEVEKNDEGILIKFNPEIDPELRKHSEDALKEISDRMKYMGLRCWAESKFRREEEKYKKYSQYEGNPAVVLKEIKEIIEGLKVQSEEEFGLFNRSIPAYATVVLVRDYFDKLNKEEKEFCKLIIITFASVPLNTAQYIYQVSDGAEASISVLPQLIQYFPKEKKRLKILLLNLILNPTEQISTFAIRSVLYDLWKIDFNDANSIFLGFLKLSPRYDALIEEIRKKEYRQRTKTNPWENFTKVFLKRNRKDLEKIANNNIFYNEIEGIENLDLNILKTAFELLPVETTNGEHIRFMSVVFQIFSKKIFQYDRSEKVNYTLRHRFLNKFAYYILHLPKDKIGTQLKPFVDNFENSREMAEFFQEFISAEDKLFKPEQFWTVWDYFYDCVAAICKNGTGYNKEVIHNYLLDTGFWKKDAKDWHTLKDKGKAFYKKVAEDMGSHSSVFDSLAYILSSIGICFSNDGLSWLSYIIQKNKNLSSDELERNTVYYLENFTRKYILENRSQIRGASSIKGQVIVILNFLVERGSIVGYLLRDDIL